MHPALDAARRALRNLTSEPEGPQQFGTFTGVFLPTLLTILGVIMYVRTGWVVGHAGLGGALAVIGLGLMITTCTGLSLSSIATNTRIGPGGPYAIMNRSLGVEVGGSIGIPLFLTRPLGVAMYIFGFREGWLWMFPGHHALVVDLCIFAALFGLAYKSAGLAFKAQYAILVVIGLSLISIFASDAPATQDVEITWIGDFEVDFWAVFAVFFPATTGILAGANMSGDLKDPRRDIPRGTMAAIGLSAAIYVAIAVWAARAGTLDELAHDTNLIIDRAWVPGLVVAGLLGATASSALAGLVGGPRLLAALGENGVVPGGHRLAQLKGGEPRAALVVTGLFTLACIAVRDLNNIAPLVTMFFLITYCMINVVVLIEKGLGLVSYRPTLDVPIVVPLLGLLGCAFSMFIVNPTFSLVSVTMVFALYLFIRRRGLQGDGEDVRSSFFVGIAEWAAGKVTPEDLDNVRAWKPHILVPVEERDELRGSVRVLLDLARPEGSVKLLGLTTRRDRVELEDALEDIGRKVRERGVEARWSTVGLSSYTTGVGVGMQALQGAFFRPNLLFLRLPAPGARRQELAAVVQIALHNKIGVALLCNHPEVGLGQGRDIHLWVRRGLDGWEANAAFDSGNLNLILLMGYRLSRVWGGALRVITVVGEEGDRRAAQRFLDELCDLARFGPRVQRLVVAGPFQEALARTPAADLSIFGLHRTEPDPDRAEQITMAVRSTSLFVLDSGRESARA
jgi:solute carrier family 12 sodium/potassium/chloride transporter 2